jgi:hypothetical protein
LLPSAARLVLLASGRLAAHERSWLSLGRRIIQTLLRLFCMENR